MNTTNVMTKETTQTKTQQGNLLTALGGLMIWAVVIFEVLMLINGQEDPSFSDWLYFRLFPVGCLVYYIGYRLEKCLGSYRCRQCGHIHTPKRWHLFFGFNFSDKKRLTCPQCDQRTLQEKI